MMISRRILLTGASALALVSCNLTTSQIQSDVEAIAAGLSSLVTALAPLGVSPDILAKAQTLINQIKSDAALIASGLSPTGSIVTDIANAVTALSALVTPFFPMAPAIAAAIQAALVLVNVILVATGATTPAPTAAAMAKFKAAMTPDEARAILKRYAATGIR